MVYKDTQTCSSKFVTANAPNKAIMCNSGQGSSVFFLDEGNFCIAVPGSRLLCKLLIKKLFSVNDL